MKHTERDEGFAPVEHEKMRGINESTTKDMMMLMLHYPPVDEGEGFGNWLDNN